ncbi:MULTISPECIES: acyl-CoA dehydrogenase family protein [unclassified Shinella]|uniref:acyl-CoA dehydrogenase family protein n=1 Tax=unclassified Shinella TaxID=2643062 RepID=UPI00225D2040|nr:MULTISPECIES: acyl-CoA dehydrogenase family protein [unclassified Shinella]MCO5137783.1 acyl-CoA dehydrogenase family protein [Shinella sp.]MDC7257900.1 acyl-CoA dehydrogenase family protein [Shinella sp. YE25]CAI0335349.1 Monooxygenase [Rhizobiaceae bacterium]CAK7259659.1 Monooxygenase [Shinella sp. WSC3-e]
MTQIDNAWGAGPGERYEALAAPFRPIFAEIAAQATARDLGRDLPYEAIRRLKEAGFGAVRLPVEAGGKGASLPQFFNLLIELSAADSNVTQTLRAHFGFTEDILNTKDAARRALWVARIARGETAGSAWSEIGAGAALDRFSTTVAEKDGRLVLNGEKYYTTGSLFADWIDVGASDAAGEGIAVAVRREAAGVAVIDDWDGFGQTLTASGTAIFRDVVVEPGDIVVDDERFKYSAAFYQLVHLATLAGIGRAIAADVAKAVVERRRTYTHAAAARPSEDPQVLQVVGRIRAAAYAAGAITLQAANGVQRAFEAHFVDDAEAEEKANAIAELEAAQAQTVVSDLILEAATLLFDALGASATKKSAGLDRHWRNARTLASHNPRIYKHRIIGDFAVNGTPPPYQWRIGASAG